VTALKPAPTLEARCIPRWAATRGFKMMERRAGRVMNATVKTIDWVVVRKKIQGRQTVG
jgi:hypothetical protein